MLGHIGVFGELASGEEFLKLLEWNPDPYNKDDKPQQPDPPRYPINVHSVFPLLRKPNCQCLQRGIGNTSLLHLGLVRYRFHRLLDFFRIAQIVIPDWFHFLIQFVHEWHPCRNIQTDDLLV